jgi:glycerol-3-phosphate acyltransferase PlsX
VSGVQRPAIATPIPEPGGTPTILLDAGANAECQADWLVQFAQMGCVYARERFKVADPRVALLSIGEEPTKGNDLVKATHGLLADGRSLEACGGRFIGNVEGRDLMTDAADVVVTDGFTGNVALKTLEGGLKSLVAALLGAFDATDESRAAAEVLTPALAPLYDQLDPDNTGGAVLLGVKGVCIISHGSSRAGAMVNAIQVAAEAVEADVVGRVAEAVAAPEAPEGP